MPSTSSSAEQALDVLAARLRQLRREASLSGRELARLAGWDASKISRLEHARRRPTVADLRAWSLHCGAPAVAAELVATLEAIEGMFVEWRHLERTGLRKAQEAVVPRWERTRQFRIYSSKLIPGPLQTGPYIRAVLTALMHRRGLPDDVDDAVRVRLGKQHVVNEGDHRFAVVLEESVLRAPIGGVEVMSAQLGHLLALGAMPSVSLGIVPLGADRSSMWPAEAFFIFDDAEVTVELVSGHLTVTQPHEIGMYAGVFAELAELAVYGKAARALITRAITALDD